MARRRVLAVIPARWGSTRFPGKPLAHVGGVPMVVRTLERAAAARRVDAVLVATDDERIRATVEAAGGSTIMTPAGCATGTDRVLAATSGLGLDADDVVINVQGDEPLVDPAHIDLLADALLDSRVPPMATLAVREAARPELADPNLVKVVLDRAGDALYFSRSLIPFQREASPFILRHIGLYAFRFHFLQTYSELPPSELEAAEGLEQLRVLEAGHKLRVLPVVGPVAPGIDTPEQLASLEAQLALSAIKR